MFCSKCGQTLPDDAAFCPQCGNKVEAQPAEPQSVAQPQQPGIPQQPGVPTPANPEPVQQPAQPEPASPQPTAPQQPGIPQQPGAAQPNVPQPVIPQGAQPAPEKPKKKGKKGIVAGVIAALLAFAVFSGIGSCVGGMMSGDLTEDFDVEESMDIESSDDYFEEPSVSYEDDDYASADYVVGTWLGTGVGEGDSLTDVPSGTMELIAYSGGTTTLNLDGDVYSGTWTNEGYDTELGHDYYFFNFDDGTQWIGGADGMGGLMLLDMDDNSDYYMTFEAASWS